MSKLKINLFVADDNFTEAYPVTIFAGNIIPATPNALPFIKDDSVNFTFQYSEMYLKRTNDKCNTRFLYPYSRNYKNAGTEGRYEAFAKLSWWQLRKLHLINNSSVIQREKKIIITVLVTLLLGLLASIPLWIPLFCSESSTNNRLRNTNSQQKIINNQADIDSSQFERADTLQQKEQLK